MKRKKQTKSLVGSTRSGKKLFILSDPPETEDVLDQIREFSVNDIIDFHAVCQYLVTRSARRRGDDLVFQMSVFKTEGTLHILITADPKYEEAKQRDGLFTSSHMVRLGRNLVSKELR